MRERESIFSRAFAIALVFGSSTRSVSMIRNFPSASLALNTIFRAKESFKNQLKQMNLIVLILYSTLQSDLFVKRISKDSWLRAMCFTSFLSTRSTLFQANKIVQKYAFFFAHNFIVTLLPIRALPLPFWAIGFLPEPATVPLVLVIWVLISSLFYLQRTYEWTMSLRKGTLKISYSNSEISKSKLRLTMMV